VVPHLVFVGVDGVHERLKGHQVGSIDGVYDTFEVGVVEVAVLAPKGPSGRMT